MNFYTRDGYNHTAAKLPAFMIWKPTSTLTEAVCHTFMNRSLVVLGESIEIDYGFNREDDSTGG